MGDSANAVGKYQLILQARLQMTSIISTAAQAAYNVATYILAYASTQVGRNVFVAEVMDAEKSVSKVRSCTHFD